MQRTFKARTFLGDIHREGYKCGEEVAGVVRLRLVVSSVEKSCIYADLEMPNSAGHTHR
jgi:hypothetical protein